MYMYFHSHRWFFPWINVCHELFLHGSLWIIKSSELIDHCFGWWIFRTLNHCQWTTIVWYNYFEKATTAIRNDRHQNCWHFGDPNRWRCQRGWHEYTYRIQKCIYSTKWNMSGLSCRSSNQQFSPCHFHLTK